jgi:hypothetical protein
MAEITCAGLPLKAPDDMVTPLGAVVVVKALDGRDEVSYYILKTDDILRVEAVGMLVTASDEFRASLADLAREPDG